MGLNAPRVAIVHEWFVTYDGSEKVLEEMPQVFPEANIFCALDFSTRAVSRPSQE
jgi:hypothetical protein